MNPVCHLIANPASGSAGRYDPGTIIRSLAEKGFETHLHLTGNRGDAAQIASDLAFRTVNPLIAVSGGDGTVNEVLNGCANRTATVAVIPAGTANVLAGELGITGVSDAIDRIARGTRKPVSLGILEKDGTKQWFAMMAGAGFDGSLVKNVDTNRKRRIGKAEYLFSGLKELIGWNSDLLRVSCDAGSFECHSLIASNISRYGGRFVIAPGTDMFTPLFSVLCFMRSDRPGFLRSAAGLLLGERNIPGVFTIKTSRLTVEGTKPVQVDGDYICDTPVRLEAAATAVSIIV